LPELGTYRRLEGLFPIANDPELNQLVVPSDNDQLPVHRWFRFKEGFSADLLKRVLGLLELSNRKSVCMLDSFCGSGTALLSAQELSQSLLISATGIERNPLIHFVAKTK